MSVIIRLQNLPWTANALDIRRVFHGLSIPDGGVHIVGGDNGDAFIAFSSDEDARKAMHMDGTLLMTNSIKLFLSSKSEMQNVISVARGGHGSQPQQQQQQQQQQSMGLGQGNPQMGQQMGGMGGPTGGGGGGPPQAFNNRGMQGFDGPGVGGFNEGSQQGRQGGFQPVGLSQMQGQQQGGGQFGRAQEPRGFMSEQTPVTAHKPFGESRSQPSLGGGNVGGGSHGMRGTGSGAMGQQGGVNQWDRPGQMGQQQESVGRFGNKSDQPQFEMRDDRSFSGDRNTGVTGEREPINLMGRPDRFGMKDLGQFGRQQEDSLGSRSLGIGRDQFGSRDTGSHEGRDMFGTQADRGSMMADKPMERIDQFGRREPEPLRGNRDSNMGDKPMQFDLSGGSMGRRNFMDTPSSQFGKDIGSLGNTDVTPFGREKPLDLFGRGEEVDRPGRGMGLGDTSSLGHGFDRDRSTRESRHGGFEGGMEEGMGREQTGYLDDPQGRRGPDVGRRSDFPRGTDRTQMDQDRFRMDGRDLDEPMRRRGQIGLNDERPAADTFGAGARQMIARERSPLRRELTPTNLQGGFGERFGSDRMPMDTEPARNDRFSSNSDFSRDKFEGQRMSRMGDRFDAGRQRSRGENVYMYLSNMPTSISYRDIRRFFVGCAIPNNGLKLINDDKGQRNGTVYVMFSSEMAARDAIQKAGQMIAPNHRIRIVPTTAEQFENAKDSFVPRDSRPTSPKRGKLTSPSRKHDTGPEDNCVQLKNLPYHVDKQEIKSLFSRSRIAANGGPFIDTNAEGRPTGVAFVEFERPRDFKEALTLNRKNLNGRIIDVISIRKRDYDERVEKIRAKGREREAEHEKQKEAQKEREREKEQEREREKERERAREREREKEREAEKQKEKEREQEREKEREREKEKNVQRSSSKEKRDENKESKDAKQGNSSEKSRSEKSADTSSGRKEKCYCVKLDGLPFSANNTAVKDFFKGLDIAQRGIHIIYNDQNKASGKGFVEFVNSADCDKAVGKNKEYMGKRYITVIPITKRNMLDELQQLQRKDRGRKETSGREAPRGRGTGGHFGGRGGMGQSQGNERGMNESREMGQFGGRVGMGMFGGREEIGQFGGREEIGQFGRRDELSQYGRGRDEVGMFGGREDLFSGREGVGMQGGRGDLGLFGGRGELGDLRDEINQYRGRDNLAGDLMNLMGDTTVNIFNVPYRARPQDIVDFFHGFRIVGRSVRVHQSLDGQPSGEASVMFQNPQEAMMAVRQLNNREMLGRCVELVLQ